MTPRTQNLRIRGTRRLKAPAELQQELPATAAVSAHVVESRKAVEKILSGEDSRLLIILGPCSIHDTEAALDYARRLQPLREDLSAQFEIVMRVYFEKPRTVVGWKGLINDPSLDDSCDIEKGLQIARELLLDINALGIPAATEFLDPFVPQYIADLIAWAAIGARTTESQTHRELASGLSMPVGYKNGTDGGLQVAMDAMVASRSPHTFLGVDPAGNISLVRSTGNPHGHVVLRGGRGKTNYDPESIAEAAGLLAKAGLPPIVMVDCSHANSSKQHARQEAVWRSIVEQKIAGDKAIIGAMIESHIHEGNQPFPQPIEQLSYGVSITDACIAWETTEKMLRWGAEKLSSR